MSNEASSGKTKKSPIAKLPPGVTVDKMMGSGGNEYWRVRLGKKFTGTKAITKYFKTLSAAREWITGDAKDEKVRCNGFLDRFLFN